MQEVSVSACHSLFPSLFVPSSSLVTPVWLTHGSQSFRGVPVLAWAAHSPSPFRAVPPPPMSASAAVCPTTSLSMSSPFCFSKSVSSQFFSCVPFLCVLLCLLSHLLLVPSPMCPHMCPFASLFVPLHRSPLVSPAPVTKHPFLSMSVQSCRRLPCLAPGLAGSGVFHHFGAI